MAKHTEEKAEGGLIAEMNEVYAKMMRAKWDAISILEDAKEIDIRFYKQRIDDAIKKILEIR